MRQQLLHINCLVPSISRHLRPAEVPSAENSTTFKVIIIDPSSSCTFIITVVILQRVGFEVFTAVSMRRQPSSKSRSTQYPCRRATAAVIAKTQYPLKPRSPLASRKPWQLSTSISYPEPIQQRAQRHPEHQPATSRQRSQLQERGLSSSSGPS
jgi:hypothetical protein